MAAIVVTDRLDCSMSVLLEGTRISAAYAELDPFGEQPYSQQTHQARDLDGEPVAKVAATSTFTRPLAKIHADLGLIQHRKLARAPRLERDAA